MQEIKDMKKKPKKAPATKGKVGFKPAGGSKLPKSKKADYHATIKFASGDDVGEIDDPMEEAAESPAFEKKEEKKVGKGKFY